MASTSNDTSADAVQSSPVHVDPHQGIFETLLIFADLPMELDAHLRRLRRSARTLYGHTLEDIVRAEIMTAAESLGFGRLRVDLVPAGSGSMTAEIATSLLDQRNVFPGWTRAVSLTSVQVPGGVGCHKWVDRQLLTEHDRMSSPSLPLITNETGLALEASRGNLFIVEDGILVTPPTDGQILPGITRNKVIDLARELRIKVTEEELPIDRMMRADEVFLTGSLRGIEPVKMIDRQEFQKANKITSGLSATLRKSWLGDRTL